MKLFILLLSIVLVGCNSTKPSYSTVGKKTEDPNCPDYSETSPGFYGGDGSSEEQAIETVGVYFTPQRWIIENYPDATPTLQSLVRSSRTGLMYDVISMTTKSGEKKELYFWLSGGFSCYVKSL